MKKLLLFLLFPLIAASQEGNNQADIGGLLIASNFANWTVPQGNQGGYSWSSPDFCKVQFAGTDFNAFSVGTPVAIVDTGNPSNSETVTVNQFNSQTGGCSITVNPTHVHNTFFFRSATAGLGEALAYAGKQSFQIIVTPDFTKLGGTTSTITSASGGTNVPILDQRSSVIVPYIWNGTAYASQPFAGGAINPGGTIGAIQYFATGPNFGGLNGTGLVKDNGASPPTIAAAGTDYALPNANTTGTAGGLSGSPAITVSNVTDSALTSGNCVQASTGGLLTTTSGACGSGSGGAPTGTAGGALSGTYPNPTIVGTTIQPAIIDGAVYAAGVNGAGIGVAQSSWSSATAYPQCSAVSHSGNYLGVAASTNVTPGTNSAIWYPVPNGNTPTAGDCAFYLAASKVNGVAGAQLILPPGITATNLGFVEPTVTSPGNPVVAIFGAGKQASILRQTASISNAVVTQPNTAVAFAFAGLDLEGFTVDANFLAPAAINVYGAQQFKLAHLRLENPTDGSDHYIEFGHPSTANHTLAWTYEPELDDIDTLNSHGPGSGAGLSVSVSGGVPTITINSGGTSYNPTYSQLVLSGSGAFADVPCTSRGTDTINVSGGVISSITTTATGCTGPLYASVFGGNQVTYCFKFNDTSDSKLISGLTPSECNTGVYNSNAVSQMKFIGTHPIATYAGIVDQGNNTYIATQIDSVYRYGFDLQGATNIDSISATDFEYSLYLPGASDYHILHPTGSPTTAPFAVYISSDLCGNAPSFGGYYHFITPSGGGNSFIPAFVHAYESISCDSHGASNLPDYAGNWSAGGSITANGNLYGWNGIADMVSVNQAKLAYQFNDVTALGQALSNSQWLFDDVTGDTDVVWQSGHSLRFGIANSNSAAYFDSAGLFHAGGVTLSGTLTSNGPAALNGASTAVTQTIGDSSNKIATTSFVNSAISSGNIFGNIYPAQCAGSGAPSWCSGSTADSYIRAACAALPSSGGVVNLSGLTGNIAATTRGCTTPSRLINFIQTPSTHLTVTETDGDIAFPLDNGSAWIGLGVGQCLVGGRVKLSSSANITAIVGPAHTDGTQESFAVSGGCFAGDVGATVSQALLYAKNNFANTTFQGNNLFQCNTYCLKVQNGSDIRIFNNWLDASEGVSGIVGQPLLILGSGNGTGFNIGPVEVFNNQIEHAQGANSAEITVVGDGAGALAGAIHIYGNGIERDTGGTPSTTGISITDCQACSVEGLAVSGSSGGTDGIKISQSTSGRTQNVTISNVLAGGAYTNSLNDTIASRVLTYSAVPQIAEYNVAQGYIQGPSFTGPVSVTGPTSGAIGLTANSSIATAPTSTVLLTVPTSVTAYALELPGVAPTSVATYLNCTSANPSICSWTNTVAGINGQAIAPASVSSPGPLTALSDGVHSGYDSLIGNTANQAVIPNTAGFMGPNLASFTGYALGLPPFGPTGATQSQALLFAGPSSGVSEGRFTPVQTYPSGPNGVNFVFAGDSITCGLQSSSGCGTSPITIPSNGYTATTTGTASSGSTSMTIASATNIVTGELVVGAGIAPSTICTLSGTTCTLSVATTAALSSTPVNFGKMDYPAQAMRLPSFNGHGTGTNLGVAGWTTTNLQSDYTTHVHPLSPAVTGLPGYLFVMIGINDITVTGSSAATIEAALITYYATAAADGWNITALTILPAPLSQAQETVWVAVNQWIRSQAGKWNNFTDGAFVLNDNRNSQNFSSDFEHPSNAGYSLLARAVNQQVTTSESTASGPIIQALGSGTGNYRGNLFAGFSLTTGSNNSFAGDYSGASTTTGSGNTCYGPQSCEANQTGDNLIGIGLGALISATAPNIAIGVDAGANPSFTGTTNIILGNFTGDNLTTGNYNMLIGGCNALTTGQLNSCIGIGSDVSTGTANGRVQIGSGTNSADGTLQFQNIPLAGGSTFGVSGCGTITAATGSAFVGRFTAASTTCAPVITPGVTAPTGFVCDMSDRTTPADFTVHYNTSDSVTTATWPSQTIVSGDVMAFRCSAY